jgi:AcrR family transcriptional regulator
MPDDSTAKSSRRRRSTPSKGDLRERAILDAAEEQLATVGLDAVTVETLATAAGISRAAFYFYFGSRDGAIAALVDRVVTSLESDVRPIDEETPAESIRRGVEDTARMWLEHGPVARAAVELAPSVPSIEERWRAAEDVVVETTRAIAERAGFAGGSGPRSAEAVTRALMWMTERRFYEAYKAHEPLDDVAETLSTIWLAALDLDLDPV